MWEVDELVEPRIASQNPSSGPGWKATSPAIAVLRHQLDAATSAADHTAVLEAFWSQLETTPLLETDEWVEVTGDDPANTRIVTFLWRCSPEHYPRVLLYADSLLDGHTIEACLMENLPGTDLWHLSCRMAPDWRASYVFHPLSADEWLKWSQRGQSPSRRALESGRNDPRNPYTCLNRSGHPMSVVELADAPPQPWLVRREDVALRGSVTKLRPSNGRKCK